MAAGATQILFTYKCVIFKKNAQNYISGAILRFIALKDNN